MAVFPFSRHLSLQNYLLPSKVVCATSRLTLTFLLTLTLPLGSRMYPHGPPHQACDSMLPHHGAAPQNKSTSPYDLVILDDVRTYSPGQKIKVSIQGTPFVGFMLQVRRAARGNVVTLPLGTFTRPPTYARYLDCSEQGDTITHANNGPKWNMEFTWKPPDRSYGPVHFITTLVFSKTTYWMNVTSRVLYPLGYPDVTTHRHHHHHDSFPTLPLLNPTTTTTTTTPPQPPPKAPPSTTRYDDEFSLATITMVTKMTSLVETKTTSSHMIVEAEDHFPLIGGATASEPTRHLVLVIATVLSISTWRIL